MIWAQAFLLKNQHPSQCLWDLPFVFQGYNCTLQWDRPDFHVMSPKYLRVINWVFVIFPSNFCKVFNFCSCRESKHQSMCCFLRFIIKCHSGTLCFAKYFHSFSHTAIRVKDSHHSYDLLQLNPSITQIESRDIWDKNSSNIFSIIKIQFQKLENTVWSHSA